MKNVSKSLSLSLIGLFLAFFTIVACKKEIENIESPSNKNSTKLTAYMLSNDVYFYDFLLFYNEFQSKLSFLDNSKSENDRKNILNELNRLSRTLTQQGDATNKMEQQKVAELLGYSSVSELKSVLKEFSIRKDKVLTRFSLLKEGDSQSNSQLLKSAHDFAQRYLFWMVVNSKEHGTYALSKTAWKNYLDNISANLIECPPSEWGESCKNTVCENAEILNLKNIYSTCNGNFLEQMMSFDNLDMGNIIEAVVNYGNAMDNAKQNFEFDVANCQ